MGTNKNSRRRGLWQSRPPPLCNPSSPSSPLFTWCLRYTFNKEPCSSKHHHLPTLLHSRVIYLRRVIYHRLPNIVLYICIFLLHIFHIHVIYYRLVIYRRLSNIVLYICILLPHIHLTPRILS